MDELQKATARLRELERQAEARPEPRAARSTRGSPPTRRSCARRSPRRPPRAASSRAKIDKLIAQQFQPRQHPVASTTARCTGRCRASSPRTSAARASPGSRRSGDCAHFHNGIDIVGRLRDAGPGVGRRARRVHRLELRRRRRPRVHRDRRPLRRALDLVRPPADALPGPGGATWSRKGQVIGYEGNTGHSTGAHLHWMVEFNGSFVNPRLFT